MSKVKLQKHIAVAQRQLIKIKEKNQKYVPGTMNLQILGCGAPGAPASVYLFTDQSRYLFNCGEGTQRLAHEYKMKLTRLEHIFITRNSWNCIGGLPGLSLTIQDAGVANITLHGPPKLDELFQAMRNFVILKQLQVDAPECNDNDFYEDSVLRIDYIHLRKEKVEGSCDLNDTIMSFICKCKPRPGALSLEKCLEFGVPRGPLLGKLKNGEIVILENGTTVRPEDVCEPDDPGPTFIVIDIPAMDYFKSLRTNERIREYKNNAPTTSSNTVNLILHFSPSEVVDTDEYREFVASFPDDTKHLILNEKNAFSGYIAAHRLQWQLNQLNDNIFPVLREKIETSAVDEPECCHKKIKLNDENTAEIEQTSECMLAQNLEHTSSMTCFHLRPNKGMDRSQESKINPSEYIKEITDVDGVIESLENLKQIRLNSLSVDRSNQYPKIVFLGTGSCIPNKTRNVSSILIHTTKDTCILLDAGEGTCGQIIRFYGDEAYNVIRKIKAVFISHLHADHHIGLFGVLQMRKRLLKEAKTPILLLAPLPIKSWLTFYDAEIEAISSDYDLVPNQNLIQDSLPEDTLASFGLISMHTCFVLHCPNAFAVELTINNQTEPFKITYSGDTKPCDNLVKLGIDSTLLIHEATMEDELYEDALAKMHSTVSQAIEQGRKMNAEYILLTHFSQRYAKIPRIEQHLVRNVGIAFDNMEVVPSDLGDLNELYPTMKKVFAEHWEDMEYKSLKRAHKKAIAQLEAL